MPLAPNPSPGCQNGSALIHHSLWPTGAAPLPLCNVKGSLRPRGQAEVAGALWDVHRDADSRAKPTLLPFCGAAETSQPQVHILRPSGASMASVSSQSLGIATAPVCPVHRESRFAGREIVYKVTCLPILYLVYRMLESSMGDRWLRDRSWAPNKLRAVARIQS